MTFPAIDSARFDAAARAGTPVLKLPSVNLLSPRTLQRLAVRRARRRLVAGGLVAVVFVGGGWVVQSARLNSAHQQLTDAQAATAPLSSELNALAPVATFYSELDARKTAASSAMAAEVLFSAALTDLNSRTPANMLITNLAVTLTPSVVTAVAPPVSPLTKAGIDANGNDTTSAAAQAAASGTGSASGTAASGAPATGSASAGASCAQQDPFDPTAVIGCITLSGTAPSRAVVGDFINNLKASQLYATPFITTTTATGANGVQQVQFNGSVGLTAAAVSGRYADLSWLADPKVMAAAQAMIAAGDTASNRLAKETAALQALQQAEAAAAAKAQAAAATAAQQAAENAAAQELRAAAAAALAASQAASGQSTSTTSSSSTTSTSTTTTKGN
jgi:hypothetical protein